MATTTFEASHVKTIYRALLKELQIIPDKEIRLHYGQRYRQKAQVLFDEPLSIGGNSPGKGETKARLQRSRYLGFKKNLRQITSANAGDHLSYNRLISQTYARSGPLRHTLLSALYPPSLSRPSLETISSSNYPRRLIPPPKFTKLLEVLTKGKVKKASKVGPRESLKGQGRRREMNDLWWDRTELLDKVELPLVFGELEMPSNNDKNKPDQLGSEERMKISDSAASVLLTSSEKGSYEEWQRLGKRLHLNATRLSLVPQDRISNPSRRSLRIDKALRGKGPERTHVPLIVEHGLETLTVDPERASPAEQLDRWTERRSGLNSLMDGVEEKESSWRSRKHLIPARTRRRMYQALLARIPIDPSVARTMSGSGNGNRNEER